MKNWLAFVCVLGSLCGGVFSMYQSVSIGSEGLKSLSASLTSISKVMNTYYNSLNSARNKVMPSITNLQTYVNTTYGALNASYGATQPNMESVMNSVEWFSRQFYYGEQAINSFIGYDLNQLNSQLQQTVDSLMQSYNSIVMSFSYEGNSDSCAVQFADVFTSIPSQLTKFGQCLQAEVEYVPTLVQPLKDIFAMVLSDVKSLTKQIDICAALSASCINEYFNEVYMELNYVNMELNMAQHMLYSYQQDFMQRNSLCGELIRYNIQDTTQTLQMQYSTCIWPQSPMG